MSAFERLVTRPLLRMGALDSLASAAHIHRAAPVPGLLDQMAGYMHAAWAHGASLDQVAAAVGLPITEADR